MLDSTSASGRQYAALHRARNQLEDETMKIEAVINGARGIPLEFFSKLVVHCEEIHAAYIRTTPSIRRENQSSESLP
jgi:hypothetical protein